MPEFSTIKRIGAVLIALAVVLAAGIVVGQAPSIFGVDEDPEASIVFEDQQGDGASVTVSEVSLSDGGFVVVTDSSGSTVGVSAYLEAGTHENVTVNQTSESDLEMLGQVTATVHRDTTDDETYDYNETDRDEDRPYIQDGYPVSETATVTITDGEELPGESFTVESIDAPATAMTNETITVTAELRNPTESVDQQQVDLRLDGSVLERQILELEPNEQREISFNASTNGADAKNQTIGVYTTNDGAIEMIDLEFDGTPSVDPHDGNATTITVDAEIPTEGFVAVERGETTADRTMLGTSAELSPGTHENVTVELEDELEADQEVTVALYEGDPAEPDDATQVETEDGEPVETSVAREDL